MPFDLGLLGEIAIEVGARSWDAIKNRKAPYNTEQFTRAHEDNLRQCIDYVAAVDLSKLTEKQLDEHADVLLRSIVAVVKANIRDDRAIVNASYMVPIASTTTTIGSAHFCDRRWAPEAFACFLDLKRWAYDSADLPAPFILPVAKSPEDILFGAPRAFATDLTAMVRNTKSAHKQIDRKRHEDVHHDVKKYFRDRSYKIRSFASLPLRPPSNFHSDDLAQFRSKNLGVVNVHANKTSVLGVFEGNQRKMCSMLSSYLQILSYFVAYRHFRNGQNLAGSPTV